jgi:hypothetical protein
MKRAFDSYGARHKEIIKPNFLFMRQQAISLFGEATLLDAAKLLKDAAALVSNESAFSLGQPKGDQVAIDPPDSLKRITPEQTTESANEEASIYPQKPLPISTPERTPFKVPIASPEAISACCALIQNMIEAIRLSYSYNAVKLRASLDRIKTQEGLTDNEVHALSMIAAGPLGWIKATHPELALQISAIEQTLEQAAIIGALQETELNTQKLLAYWQKVLGQWQAQVDKFFPGLNAEGEE